MSTQTVSKQTQKNWWIDAGLFLSAIIASLSGIYFLYLPTGGYQGGRNPTYGLEILFTRHTWDDLHTWGGAVMIIAALIHLSIHWSWVVNMTRRIWNEFTGKCRCMNWRGRWNLILNAVVALSFLLTAISGIYFLFFSGSHQAPDPMFLFARSTWDSIHTWAGVMLIIAAVLHFVIHWNWVVKVTRRMIGQVVPGHSASQPVTVANI
jgi:hypothetical protein